MNEPNSKSCLLVKLFLKEGYETLSPHGVAHTAFRPVPTLGNTFLGVIEKMLFYIHQTTQLRGISCKNCLGTDEVSV